jgi:MFS family permease
LAARAAALIFFVVWELNVAEPMLDMRFFQNPRFTAANGAITMTFFALFGSMFLMTQYWQLVHGYTPLGAGVRLIPYALTMMITAPLSARFVERIGSKRVITTGLLIVASALVTLSFIHATTPYPRVISVFCVMAVGMGLTMAPATESVMGSLPRHKAGVGSAVNDTTRQVGGALGVAIIGSVVTSLYASRSGDVASRFGLDGPDVSAVKASLRNALDIAATLPNQTATAFQSDVKDAFVGSLVNGLRLSASVILVAAFVVWRFLPARAHDHIASPDAPVSDPAIAVSAGGG